MANTPKSERRYNKSSAACDRAFDESYAHLTEDGHPSHKRASHALDRVNRTVAHTNRDYTRHVHRDQKDGACDEELGSR